MGVDHRGFRIPEMTYLSYNDTDIRASSQAHGSPLTIQIFRSRQTPIKFPISRNIQPKCRVVNYF